MKYINQKGESVELKTVTKKKKKKVKIKLLRGQRVSYVGYTKTTGDRIVLYHGTIKSQDNDINPKIVEVEFEDQHKDYKGNIVITKLDLKYLTFINYE